MLGNMKEKVKSDNNPSPAKKRRLAVPDGFSVEHKSPVNIPPPKFVSGFNKPSSVARKPLSTSSRHAEKFPRPITSDRPPLAGPSVQNPVNMRVRKPPVLPPDSRPSGATSPNKQITSMTALKPVLPPPQDSSRSKLTSINRVQPRPTSPPAARRIAPLKSLVPPPVAGPSRNAAPALKTIFTTNVARITDLRSETGAAELLSIFLQEHGHGFVDPTERELQRGLEQSPEKTSKRTKDAKFAAGGLAERARMRFRQSQTALSLWQTGIELKMRQNRSIAPDMRLRVVTVLHAASADDHQRVSHAPCLGLVRCRVISRSGEEDITVLLNFDGIASVSTPFNKLTDLEDGREVYIWRPWYSSPLPSESSLNTPDALGDPPQTGVDLERQGIDPEKCRSVLFCFRFWICPPQ